MHGVVRKLALLFAVVTLSGAGVARAAPQSTAMEHLKVAISTSGPTVWGKVAVRYMRGGKTVRHTCSHASCRYTVAKGTKVTLKETPTTPSTWPFSKWVVKTGGKTTKKNSKTITLTVRGAVKVTAVYVYY